MELVPLFPNREQCRNIVSIQIDIPPLNWKRRKSIKCQHIVAYNAIQYPIFLFTSVESDRRKSTYQELIWCFSPQLIASP